MTKTDLLKIQEILKVYLDGEKLASCMLELEEQVKIDSHPVMGKEIIPPSTTEWGGY